MPQHTAMSDLDTTTLNEFRIDLEENREAGEREIVRLDNNADDTNAINGLFRVLHNIKGNAQMCDLDWFSQFAHHLETLVGEIRAKRLPYVPEVGELVMLALDEMRIYIEEFTHTGHYDQGKLLVTAAIIEALAKSKPDLLANNAQAAITDFTGKLPQFSATEVHSDHVSGFDKNPTAMRAKATAVSEGHGHDEDLAFFRDIAARFYARLPYATGRIDRTLPLIHSLNEAARCPVDSRQLEAALYMHDIALAFLPDSLLLKDGKYTDAERGQVKEHAGIAADILARITGWEVAAQMVAQHHMWMDGSSGYPVCVGTTPHLGAQMLAIVDSYESMTHPRPDRQFRRSVLRAITEINALAGKQFGPQLVPIFISVIRGLVTTKTT